MKIDKAYKGLIDDGWRYRIDGDIVTIEELHIDLDKALNVSGSLKVGGSLNIPESLNISESLEVGGRLEVGWSLKVGAWLEVGGRLKVGEWLEVGEWLNVGRWLKVGESLNVGWWLKVGESLNVGWSLEVGKWLKVGEWLKVGGVISMCGVETTTIHIINGVLPYSIWLLDTHTKIGCTMLENSKWLEMTEEQAMKIGDNGEMWENRGFIKHLINRPRENQV